MKITTYLSRLLKVGILGFGGGTALIPIIEKELIDSDKVSEKESFNKDIVVATLTPGALPVELASSIGLRRYGVKGMITFPIIMAIPGALGTLLLLTLLSGLRDSIGIFMEIVTIIVCFYIIFQIIKYIKKVCRKCFSISGKFYYRSMIVMVLVFILSCGKSLYKLLGIKEAPFVSVSTLQVLIFSFLGIILINIYRAVKDIKKYKKNHEKLKKQSSTIKTSSIVKQQLLWTAILILFIFPVIYFNRDTLEFFLRAIASVFMSFGGGDAYIVIADGLFVSSGHISSDLFYSDIVPIANILPGSILCKILTAMGYCYGSVVFDNTALVMLITVASFIISVAMSCQIFGLIYFLYDKLQSFRTMHTIANYIGPIISGLLMVVILTLLNLCKNSFIALIS